MALKPLLVTFTFLVCLLSETKAQTFQSPCPQLFTYDATSEPDQWYGTLTLLSESDLSDVWLRLTFDRTSIHLGNWFGEVETSDSKEYRITKNNHELKADVPEKLRFFLKYNPNAPAPRLLTFRLNGKLMCSADTYPKGVNTQLGTSSRDKPNIQSSTNFQDSFNSNLQNGVTTQPSTNFGDKLDSQLNTNSQNFVPNTQNIGNSQFGSNLQNGVGVNSQEEIKTQLDITTNDGVNTQFAVGSQTGSRDQSNTQSLNQPSTSPQDIVNNDRATNQLNTNARDRVTAQPSTNSQEGVNTQVAPNSQNSLGLSNQDAQMGIIFPDKIKTQLAPNSRDKLNTQLGTNSPARPNPQLNISLGTTSQDSPITVPPSNIILDNVCGTVLPQPRPLIAYGEITYEGEFPWHSALYLTKVTRLTYICGATLLSRNFVITTAHCVLRKKSQESFAPEELILQLGKYNLQRFNVGYQDRQISNIVSHPQFDAAAYLNDIALLKLKTPADITEYVRPVCLWQESTDISAVLNKIGKVVGWGYDETGKLSDELMQAKMPVIPKKKCVSSYPSFYSQFTSANTYCAGFANGTSPCNGDAGGGMVFPIPDTKRHNNPVWQLRGLVSILPSLQNQILCDVTHYTIFTDVAKYLDWIVATMR